MKLITAPSTYFNSHTTYFLTFFLLFTTLTSFAQNIKWPPKQWEDSVIDIHTRAGVVELRTLPGQLILKTGDTLDGLIRPRDLSCIFLGQDKFEEISIPNDKINSIRGEAKSLGQNYLVSKNINRHGRLWRIVDQRQDVSIYDLPNYLDLSSFGLTMILVEGTKSINIYGSLFWPTRKNKNELILKFINKHYRQSFKEDDFKTGFDMINYILDKENKDKKQKT